MSDVDAAPAPAAATAKPKATKKKAAASKPKTPAAHPQYKLMVAAAISALKERGGSSRQAILKYIIANYKVGDNPTAINARLKSALKAGVKNGGLKQSKGTGAAGSFRLGDKAEQKPKVQKTVAKKPKSPKKTAKPKKPAAAQKPKSPKKPKKAAAPKKAKSPKKPAAAKPKSKIAKTPKKPAAAKPKVAKKPTAAKKPKAPKKAAAAKKA